MKINVILRIDQKRVACFLALGMKYFYLKFLVFSFCRVCFIVILLFELKRKVKIFCLQPYIILIYYSKTTCAIPSLVFRNYDVWQNNKKKNNFELCKKIIWLTILQRVRYYYENVCYITKMKLIL